MWKHMTKNGMFPSNFDSLLLSYDIFIQRFKKKKPIMIVAILIIMHANA